MAKQPTILISDTTTFDHGVLANNETGAISGARVWVEYPDDPPSELALVAAAIVSTESTSLRAFAAAANKAADDLDAARAVEK